jgi:hypothetical protein
MPTRFEDEITRIVSTIINNLEAPKRESAVREMNRALELHEKVVKNTVGPGFRIFMEDGQIRELKAGMERGHALLSKMEAQRDQERAKLEERARQRAEEKKS